LHTDWCPQTIQPGKPQLLPGEQELHGSGISDPSITTTIAKLIREEQDFRKIDYEGN